MSYYNSWSSTFKNQQREFISYRQKELRFNANNVINYDEKTSLSSTRRQNPSTTPLRTIQPSHSQRQHILQQQQINDLQRKIDLILMHNEKLQSEKQRYRMLYQQLLIQTQQLRAQFTALKINNQSKTARFVSEENSFIIQKLRRQLQLTTRSYQQKLADLCEQKRLLKEQITTLAKIIDDVNGENKTLKMTIKQQQLKAQSMAFELKEEFIRQQAELQNKLRDQFLIREIQLKNEKKAVTQSYEEQLKEMADLIQKQRKWMQSERERDNRRLLEQFEEEKREMLREVEDRHREDMGRLSQQHRREVKQQQDKAIEFINGNVRNAQQTDSLIRQQYEEEIARLKESLQSRKALIDTMLMGAKTGNKEGGSSSQVGDRSQSTSSPVKGLQNQNQLSRQSALSSFIKNSQGRQLQLSWLPQLLTMREQLSQQTTQYLQQSQLLKLKLTEKFHTDVSSLKTLYQNQIQLSSLRNQQLEQQNHRLRTLYQTALQQNIKNKKQYEEERSKMKNVIRKLNIQLQGVQQEFKLNIEGVRSMNNTFSMTMMKSMIEVKEKANFYSEENRKLRRAYEEHEVEMEQQRRLGEEKVRYFEEKYLSEREKSVRTINELKQQLQVSQQQAEQRESQLRDNLNKQHEMIHQLVSQLRKDLQRLQQQNHQLNKQTQQFSSTLKDRDQEISHLKSMVSQLEGDVEKLKLDLSMAGVDDKNHADTINQWKHHYETTISQLNEEIKILQAKLNTKHEQLVEIVKKYQLLENNMAKVVKSFSRKSQLQKKVLQVGLDANLVHNMAQLFRKQEKENVMIELGETN